MRRALARIATSKLFLVASVLVLLYALAGFALAPYLIERYVPRYAKDQLGHQASIGKVRVNPFFLTLDAYDFRLAQHTGRPVVLWQRLYVDFTLMSLFRWAWTLSDVRVDGLDVRLEVQPDGRLNIAALAQRFAQRKSDEAASDRGTPRVLLQHAAITDGSLTFSDFSDKTPVTTTLAPLNIEVVDLATLPDRHGEYTISASLPAGGAMSWRGDVSLLPIESTGTLQVKGLKLATLWALLADEIALPEPEGTADLATRYRFAYAAGKTAFGLDGIRATISALKLRENGSSEPLVALETATASDGRFDLASRELVVPKVELRKGHVMLARDSAGRIGLVDALTPKRAAKREAKPQAAAPRAEAPPFRYQLAALQLQNIGVALVDRSYQPAVAYELDVASARLQSLTNDGKTPIAFDVALKMAQGGTADARGTMAQDFRSAEAQVKLTDIALAPLQPLIAQHAALDLKSGNVSASAQVNYQAGGEGPALRATGGVDVANVLVNETDTGDRFVSWKTLSADEVAFTLAPTRLAIKEIRVMEPGVKIFIAKDRKINLTQVLKANRAENTGNAAGQAQTTQQEQSAAEQRFEASIGRVRVRNGTVDFADYSLVLPFSTRVRRFNGAIAGVSTDRASRADLKFEGRIEGSGAASAQGGLSTFDPKSFTDIRVKFDNVQMPPLSPYTATFAGHKIASGRLWLDLHYKIVKSQLQGENNIAMDDFTLGERVAAPNALDLPLDLAIAILKDPQGRINVAIPVRGDVNRPEFSYGSLIREALSTLVTRVVTAPFRALGRLFGRGDETLGSIGFEPGSARLLPPEREKLDKVAVALKDRPQLKLVVHGPYDPKQDGEALREEHVRRELAQALGVKLDRREDPGPIAYSDAATQRALENLFAARAGPQAADAFAQTFEKNAGRKPERVNRFLAVFGRASTDREFYQAMFERLVERYPLPEAEVQALAQRRSKVIVDYLIHSAGVDPSRAEPGDIRAVDDTSERAVTAELSLDVLKSAS